MTCAFPVETAFENEKAVAAAVVAIEALLPEHASQARMILDRFSGNGTCKPFRGRGYMLCITPRSGSSMLGDVLGRTGSVGVAMEHFEEPDSPLADWMQDCDSLQEMLRRLQQNVPGGYFGIQG